MHYSTLSFQFPGTVPEKDLRLFYSHCASWKQQKSYRETSAKEIGAEVQQIAVELTPVADCGVMRFGEVGHIFTGTWLEKQLGQNSVPSMHLAFLRNILGWLRTNKHMKCNEGFSYEVILLFLSGFRLSFTFKGKHLGNHYWIPNSFNLNP